MNNIRKTQSLILDIFKSFKDICEENNLKYFVIGGTALGAARHRGFIPWDDDLDVAMPITDYIELLRIFDATSHPNISIISPHSRRGGMICYSKIHNPNTTYTENELLCMPDCYSGVFMDIFPFCHAPESPFRLALLKTKLLILEKMSANRLSKYREKATAISKIRYVFLHLFTVLFKANYFIDKYISTLLNCEHKYQDSHSVIFPWRLPKSKLRIILPSHLFEHNTSLSFEELRVSAPNHIDEYLTLEYGDYMKLPSKDERRPAHKTGIVDLSRPYLYYARKRQEEQK